jgi:hypothetical protein
VEKIKLLDKGNIELPKNVLETFRFEKGMEFNLFFDSDTIYLKRIYKSLKDETFGEVAGPFRKMAKKEKLKPEDIAEEIKKYRKKG